MNKPNLFASYKGECTLEVNGESIARGEYEIFGAPYHETFNVDVTFAMSPGWRIGSAVQGGARSEHHFILVTPDGRYLVQKHRVIHDDERKDVSQVVYDARTGKLKDRTTSEIVRTLVKIEFVNARREDQADAAAHEAPTEQGEWLKRTQTGRLMAVPGSLT